MSPTNYLKLLDLFQKALGVYLSLLMIENSYLQNLFIIILTLPSMEYFNSSMLIGYFIRSCYRTVLSAIWKIFSRVSHILQLISRAFRRVKQ